MLRGGSISCGRSISRVSSLIITKAAVPCSCLQSATLLREHALFIWETSFSARWPKQRARSKQQRAVVNVLRTTVLMPDRPETAIRSRTEAQRRIKAPRHKLKKFETEIPKSSKKPPSAHHQPSASTGLPHLPPASRAAQRNLPPRHGRRQLRHSPPRQAAMDRPLPIPSASHANISAQNISMFVRRRRVR